MVDTSRRPAYLKHDAGRPDRWLASYADVITILLVLFVAAAASPRMRKGGDASPQEPVQSPRAVSEPKPVSPAERLSPSLTALQAKLRERNADLRVEPRGVVISLPQAVLFAPGRASISPSAKPLIEEIADSIRGIPNRISLIGHSDPTPIRNHRFRNNWELAAARSVELLGVLSNDFGIPEARLSVASFASFQPKTTNATPEGRAGNRRVEIVILADEP